MKINILKVETASQINSVANLAKEIWEEHFTPIIGSMQVEYMLKNFQSPKAISSQIRDGYQYYILIKNNCHVGYTALINDTNKQEMMISKIYVKNDARGYGVGNTIINFAETECHKQKLNKLWLTVNRHNTDSIAWYIKQGFIVIDEVNKNIGNGFYMDDFIMKKTIQTTIVNQ